MMIAFRCYHSFDTHTDLEARRATHYCKHTHTHFFVLEPSSFKLCLGWYIAVSAEITEKPY